MVLEKQVISVSCTYKVFGVLKSCVLRRLNCINVLILGSAQLLKTSKIYLIFNYLLTMPSRFHIKLILCMVGNFLCFSRRLLTFFKINVFKKFRNTIRVLNGLDPDQDQHSVDLDLRPTCLQSLSSDDKGSH